MKPKNTFLGFAILAAVLLFCVFGVPFSNSNAGAVFAAPQGKHVVATVTFAPVTVPPQVPQPSKCVNSAPHCTKESWTAPTSHVDGSQISGPITYDVFRSTVSGGPYTKVTAAPISTVTFEDDTVQGGNTYFYVVVAYADNTGPSANSNETAAIVIPLSPVNPPTGLAAVLVQ
jgi:hypothetical protein